MGIPQLINDYLGTTEIQSHSATPAKITPTMLQVLPAGVSLPLRSSS